MIEDLVKKRKQLKISASEMARIIGYSAVWVYKFEHGEHRISKDFVQKYTNTLKKYEELLNNA